MTGQGSDGIGSAGRPSRPKRRKRGASRTASQTCTQRSRPSTTPPSATPPPCQWPDIDVNGNTPAEEPMYLVYYWD